MKKHVKIKNKKAKAKLRSVCSVAETKVSPAVAPRSKGGSTLKGGQVVLCVLGPEQGEAYDLTVLGSESAWEFFQHWILLLPGVSTYPGRKGSLTPSVPSACPCGKPRLSHLCVKQSSLFFILSHLAVTPKEASAGSGPASCGSGPPPTTFPTWSERSK